MFAIRIPRNRASFGFPNTSVAAPNTARIKLKTVNVFAIATSAYDRLVAGSGSGPRSRSRRSASAAVKPLLTATAVSLTRQTRYIVDNYVVPLDVARPHDRSADRGRPRAVAPVTTKP